MEQNKSQAKQLAPLIRSDHWESLMEYVAVEKERVVTRILNCNELTEVKELQGEYKALSKLENLRTNLTAEERT